MNYSSLIQNIILFVLSIILALFFNSCNKENYEFIKSKDLTQKASVLDSLLSVNIPSFSGRIIVAYDLDKVYDKSFGYADRDEKRPYSPEIANGIASISKQFTASLIMSLYEEGKLSPSDSLGKFFNKLPNEKASITLHQLLTHSSGLPLYSGRDADPVSQEKFMDWFNRVELQTKPGEVYSYSNPGYTVLLLVAKSITGKDHIESLKDRFFLRYNLSATGYRGIDNSLAVNYDGDERIGTSVEMPWAPDGPYWNLRGSGGIISTLDDLFIWFKLLYSDEVFTKETTDMIFTPYIETNNGNGDYYGYGWHIVKDDSLGTYIDHSGSDGVKFTDIRYFKDHNLLLILTTNSFKIDEVRLILRKLEEAFELKK